MLGSNDVCTCLAVKDMAVATRFYTETLGLEPSMETPGGTFFKSGKYGVFVYPSGFAGTNQATAAAWQVSDVPATAAALAAKGVVFEHYDNMPGTTLEGDVHVMDGLKAAWFKDPDGNILNIVDRVG